MRYILVLSTALFFSSCGSSKSSAPLPVLTLQPNMSSLSAGQISIGTMTSLPGTGSKSSASTGVTPFMGGGGNTESIPVSLNASAGNKWLVIGFLDQPRLPVKQINILLVSGGSAANQPASFCCRQYLPQATKKYFDPWRTFNVPVTAATIEIGGHPPFAIAFEVPENSSSGTLVVDQQTFNISW